MEYGVSFLPDASPNSKSPEAYFRDAIDLAAASEELGFTYCKMTEHYLNQYGGYCPSPLQFLAAVAERTTTMRLLTGCVLPSFHHPVELAATTAMLDAISGGRLEVGAARGYMPYEFQAFEVDLDTSRDRYEESINVMKKLWSGDSVTHDGEFFHITSARSWPLPVQKPHPPLWGAAVRSRQSFAWLGEQGFNLLVSSGFTELQELAERVSIYRSTSEEAGHPGKVLLSLPLVIRKTEEEAQEDGRRQMEAYLDVWAAAADAWASTTSTAYKGYTGMSRGIRALGVSGLLAGGAIIGSPSSCVDQINRLLKLINPDGIIWQFDTGAATRKSMFESMERFSGEVEPQLLV